MQLKSFPLSYFSESIRKKPKLVTVVGTTGRIYDHIEKHSLNIGKVNLPCSLHHQIHKFCALQVKTIVLDEADELLSESPRNNYIDHLKSIDIFKACDKNHEYVRHHCSNPWFEP